MAFDSFLVFPKASASGITITGETQDPTPAHKSAIEIQQFSLPLENAVTIGSATAGAGAGKAKFGVFSIKKLVDSASPSLYRAAASGAHFSDAQLFIRKAGAVAGPTGSADYLIYTLKLVFITRVEWSGSTGDEAVSEAVDFVFGAMELSYAAADSTGKLLAPKTAAWDQVTNAPDITPPGA